MHHHLIKGKDFSRRAILLGGAKFAMLSALGLRLHYLQITDAEKYKMMADGNRIRIFPILPLRGKILDINGKILAGGNLRHQLLIYPHDDIDEILERISALLEYNLEKKNRLFDKVHNIKNNKKIIIDDYLSWENLAKIEVNSYELSGVEIHSSEVRNYPYGSIMAHVVGYIGKATNKNAGTNVLYRHPDFREGKTGVEKTLDKQLMGKAGIKQVEVNSRGVSVRELSSDSGVAGEDIALTIDVELQKFATAQLTGKGGLKTEGASAVVIDISNGDILAMSSVPSYDPNMFIRGIKHDDWNDIIKNPDSPLSNKAISMQYPPGSTFKTIVSLAALENNIITPHDEIYCPGYYKLGGRKFHCWKHSGHGKVNLEKALQKSCNVYFYTLSQKLGVDNIAEMAKKFGLGKKTGVELPNEKEGLVPTKKWKREVKGKPWYNGETLNVAIGQGYMLSTPLQLAVVSARLASVGTDIHPSLIHDSSRVSKEFGKLDVSAENINSVLKGMSAVVNKKGGTAYKSRIKNKKYAMGGKSGTVQVLSDKIFKYTPENKEERYHAIFIGYAPLDNPRYAISVVVEHGGYGSSVAAPIGKNILLKVQEMHKDNS